MLTDAIFMQTFLLTYRSFSTPMEILELLICRFHIPIPKNLQGNQLEEFTKTKLKPIQLRVYNFLKTWLMYYFNDFKNNNPLIERLKLFCEKELSVNYSDLSKQISSLIERSLSEDTKGRRNTITNSI